MKRNLFAPPDEFETLPLLALLPNPGRVSQLKKFTSSLYARFEKVNTMRESIEGAQGEEHQRVRAEHAMLRHVLDWMELHAEEE